MEEEFSGTYQLESSGIEDRDHEQARHNFSGDAGSWLPRKAGEAVNCRAECRRIAFLSNRSGCLPFLGVQPISDLLQEALNLLGIVQAITRCGCLGMFADENPNATLFERAECIFVGAIVADVDG